MVRNILLARHWGSNIVPAGGEVTRVGGISQVGVGIPSKPSIATVWETSVAKSSVAKTPISQVLRISLGFSLCRPLAVIVSVGSSHTLGYRVQTLGDWVQAGAGTEGNSSSITKSSGVRVTSSKTSIPGVREGSSKPGIREASTKILSLGRDRGYQGGNKLERKKIFSSGES